MKITDAFVYWFALFNLLQDWHDEPNKFFCFKVIIGQSINLIDMQTDL